MKLLIINNTKKKGVEVMKLLDRNYGECLSCGRVFKSDTERELMKRITEHNERFHMGELERGVRTNLVGRRFTPKPTFGVVRRQKEISRSELFKAVWV